MQTLDRSAAPAFQTLQDARLPLLETHHLDNGLPLHIINAGQQPVLRLELIFDAGQWAEAPDAVGSAFFAVKMLAEGTATFSSAQISDGFDRYGAFLELSTGPDRCSIAVYCLTRVLPNVLPVLLEMLTVPTFPEKEFLDLRNITAQGLRVNFEKNPYVAGVLFREQLYGPTHPYGRNQRPDTTEALPLDVVKRYYDVALRERPFRLLLAGQVGVTEQALLNQTFGQMALRGDSSEHRPHAVQPAGLIAPVLLEKPESLQSSIRVGRLLFTRQHPDYYPFIVANEVLGGYFGSRLMKNIREDKGFTYGISSGLTALRRAGTFTISTDVKKEFTQQTLDEIRNEIRRLQEEDVPADELQTVQNFMAGEYVGSLNTPFEIADRYKLLLYDGLPDDFLTQHIARIRAVTPDDIQRIARQYWQPSALLEVVVGGK